MNQRLGSRKVLLHSMTPALGGRSQLWVILTWLGVKRSYAILYSRSNASVRINEGVSNDTSARVQ